MLIHKLQKDLTGQIIMPVDQIIGGDCADILCQLPDNSVDMIFADPPYNMSLKGALWRPNQTMVDAVTDDWDQFNSFADYDLFSLNWLKECRRILKPTGSIWVIGSYHNIFRVGKLMMDLGFWMLNDVIWHKTNPMPNFRGTRFTNSTETMLWACKSERHTGFTFNYQTMRKLNDDKQMSNVWQIPICQGNERLKVNGKKVHSTQKPEALLYRVLAAASKPGDLILDPFFGTGTTGAVARKMNRHFIGIEASADYIEAASQRLANIVPDTQDDDMFLTPSKKDQPRVQFSALLEQKMIKVGQKLFDKKRQFEAKVKADATLFVNGFTGSIHQTGKQLQDAPSCNGWTYWHYETPKGQLKSIDTLRDLYLQVSSEEMDLEDALAHAAE